MKCVSPRSRVAPGLCLCLTVALAPGCESPGDPSPDKTAEIGTYAGTWTQNGTSGTFDATKSLVIGSDLSYGQTIQQYESPAKLSLASTRVVSATVTDIDVSENNAAYDTIIIEIHEIQLIPRTPGQANDWNTEELGGVTTWIQDVAQTFDSGHPGHWEHGAIWQDHVAVSVRREGDLLNVNERGHFDGQDPPEDVYFLEP